MNDGIVLDWLPIRANQPILIEWDLPVLVLRGELMDNVDEDFRLRGDAFESFR